MVKQEKSKVVSVNTVQKFKDQGKSITALTAYDYSTAKILDQAGIDIILVGDSLAMVALGHKTTHSVTIEEMIHHTKAVSRGVENSLVIADMPFMSYQLDLSSSLKNASRFISEAGAKAVKIEGCSEHTINLIKRCNEVGIPVLGHLGFTPQFLYTIGGYNIQGKSFEATNEIISQARLLQEAGVFAIVLEMVPEESAKIITESLNVPTIGIGAGRFCSGQILVTDDILGKYADFTPKFARKYVNISGLIADAVNEYRNDVTAGSFPAVNEVFNLTKVEEERLEDVKAIK